MSRSRKFERFASTDAVSADLRRKSVLGALTTGAGGALDFILRLGSTLVLARLLVPEDFGLVAMVTAITAVAEYFSTLGLSTATVQAPKITNSQCSNLFWINVAAGIFFATALVLSSPAIASFYADPRLEPISLALSLNFVSTGLTVQHEALLRRQMKLPQIALNRLAGTLLSVCLAIALALAGFGFWALVWKEVIQRFLVAVGTWLLCAWIPLLPKRHVEMRRLLTFGRDMTLTQLLIAIAEQLDSLLIGRFGSAATLGLYRQAYNIIMAPIERLRAPIYSVSQPGLSVLQREPGRYRRYYQRILFVVSFVTVPLGTFATIYAREIVLVALGDNWEGSAVFLRVFGVAAAILPALGTTGTVLVTCGKSGRFFVLSLVHNVLMVMLMVFGIPWGALGIATARVGTSVLIMPWALHYSFSGTPVSVGDFLRSVSRPVLASLVMAGALVFLQMSWHVESRLSSLVAGAGAAILVYLLAFNLLPGGRVQLNTFVAELVDALRRRSLVGVEPDRDLG